MTRALVYPLDGVRTDGWLERIGAEIENFASLCELIGERVFAFSMILGVRITTLTVNQHEPEATSIEFVVDDGGASAVTPQRLPLHEFRNRLVSALLSEEPPSPLPTSDRDLEGLRRYIGLRYLLLAPLYGYSLNELAIGDGQATITVLRDDDEELHDLESFRATIREHLVEELDVGESYRGDAIELGHVAIAEHAASIGDWERVLQLLRSWPMPLANFFRTPEGQSLAAEPRALVAKGLGLLGTACVRLGETIQGEDVFRLAVQFAGDGESAGEVFLRFGEALLDQGKAGEAIGALRRAAHWGAPSAKTFTLLARAFVQRKKYVAALGCIERAEAAGATGEDLTSVRESVEAALGPSLARYRNFLGRA